MTLLFVGPDVVDYHLISLRQLADVLDAARAALEVELAKVTEESPLHEEGDDLAGLGFVACQRYVTAIAAELGVDRATALGAGPRTSKGQALASLVNEAANAWKHEAEWREPLTKQQTRTVQRLDDELEEHAWEYKYVNALYAAAPSSRFGELVDGLVAWRDELLKQQGRPR